MHQCHTATCNRATTHKLPSGADGWIRACARCYIALTTPFMDPREAAIMTEGEFIEYVREARERSRETVAV